MKDINQYYPTGEIKKRITFSIGRLLCIHYFNKSGQFHGKTVFYYYTSTTKHLVFHYYNDNYHSLEGPAVISYDREGKIIHQSYYIHGKQYEYENWIDAKNLEIFF